MFKVRLLFFFLLYLFGTIHVIGQSYANKDFYLIDSLVLDNLGRSDLFLLDSCLTHYHSSRYDTTRIHALSYICENMNHHSWTQYQFFLSDTLDILLDKDNSSAALKFLQKAKCSALNNIGIIYMYDGDLEKALKKLNLALEIAINSEDKNLEGSVLSNMIMVHVSKGQVIEALKYYDRSYDILKEVKDKSGIAHSAYVMAEFYWRQGMDSLAFENYVKSLELCKELRNYQGIVASLYPIAHIYWDRVDTLNALIHYNLGINISDSIGDQHSKIDGMIFLANAYTKLDRKEVALKMVREALIFSRELKYKLGVSNAKCALGNILSRQGQLNEAKKYLEESIQLSREMSLPMNIRDAAKILYVIYEKEENDSKALEMHKLFVQMRDSINNDKSQRAIVYHQTKNQMDRKEQQIKLLEKEKKLKSTQLRLSMILYTLIILAIITGGLVWNRYRENRFEEELNILRALKSEMDYQKESEEISSIPITIGKKMVSVDLKNIVYFKAQSKFVFLINEEGKSYIVDDTIASLENKLPTYFVRVHRSTIINSNKVAEIKKVSRGKVVFTMQDEPQSNVQSGLVYADQVKELVKNFS